MRVLGVNTSHESSICQMTDGKIDFYHEEARFCRDKHYVPNVFRQKSDDAVLDEQPLLHMACLDHAVAEIDGKGWNEIGFVSYDRRKFRPKWSPPNYLHDRPLFEDVRQHIKSQPMSRSAWEEMETELWPDNLELSERLDDDIILNDAFASHLGESSYDFLQNEHHLYHAFSGLYMSPFKDALIVVCDGGGSQYFYDEFPQYQELESIYYMSEQDVTVLYKHLSNVRMVADGLNCPDEQYFATDQIFSMDDHCSFDLDLSSSCSEGNKYANMSFSLGLDEMGRAAGKVMGLASYGLDHSVQRWTPESIAGQLQRESLEETCRIIQRALDYKPECNRVIMSGGYALNCVNNYQYLKRFPNVEFFIDPAAHDGGTAIGMAVKKSFYNDSGYMV